MPSATRPLPRLPACQTCSQRKVKCDSNRPRCLPCSKANIDCLVRAGDGAEPLTRAMIHDLEERASAISSSAISFGEGDDISPRAPSDAAGNSAREVQHAHSNIPEGSGLGFMRLLFADNEWRGTNPYLLHNLSQTPHVAESAISPNALPSPSEGRILFDKYLSGSHVLNPFLLTQSIESLYSRIYGSQVPPTGHAKHDLFRAFMIMAIGSVTLYRNGSLPAHPFGYYAAAMHYFDNTFLSTGLEGIQDLLLIGRFGIYHHIGTSIWDITHLCLRICIEHCLHKASHIRRDLLEEQLRRRVFWECYMIDRYSSNTLHRPFAIAEKDITVGFPVDANDEAVVAAQQIFPDLDTFNAAHTPSGLSEMTVFFLCIRLRQIVSRIHSKFSQFAEPTKNTGFETFLLSGRICKTVDELLHDLQKWRDSAPVFQTPRSLYESQDWFDLLYFRERLILIRKAVDLVPKRHGIPPEHLLTQCLECAKSVITLYSRLFHQASITYTRSYFQMMFTAGLSVMFCVSVSSNLRQPAVQETLRQCEETLRRMGTKLPDAMHYVTVYEALHRNVERKWNMASLRASPVSRPVDVGRDPPVMDLGGLPSLSMPSSPMSEREVPSIGHNEQLPLMDNHFNPGSTRQTDQNTFQNEWSGNGQIADEGMQSFDFPMDDPLQWAFLNNDIFWNMEAGLGEYAYGDTNLSIPRAYDFTDI